MKRKVSILFLCLLSIFLSSCMASADRTSVRAGSAREFQKALDDGYTDITITSSFSGNFVVPRWVYSISGANRGITISPSDESKPVFDAESSTKKNLVRTAEILLWWPSALIHGAVSNSTSDSLKFSNLTILCGTKAGIDADSISKQVYVSDVTFKGIRDRNSGNFCGIHPSTNTSFNGCTFEELTWGITTMDYSGYSIEINNCTFRNVAQALSVSHSGSSAKASITGCRGENLGCWVLQHEPGTSIMYVTVDQATIDSYVGSDYYHRAVENLASNNDYNSRQFNSFIEDLSARYKALTPEARNLIAKEKGRGWDNIRLYAMTELNRKLREAELKDAENITALYSLLACAPVAELFGNDGNIPYDALLSMCEETLRPSVRDKNLLRPIVYGFLDSNELAPLTKTGARISWGSTGNVMAAFASSIEQTPDRIFRENIHRLQDWLTALDEARRKIRDFQGELQSAYPDDYRAISEFEGRVRAAYDLGIASNRVASAVFFDLPTDTAFASNFARVSRESSPSRIMGICRELGPFYSISQRLCVLNRTNTLRNEILRTWKNALAEGFFSKDNSKYEELVASLGTDPDIMRDAARISDFFREWR